jgi:hypothetical protein
MTRHELIWETPMTAVCSLLRAARDRLSGEDAPTDVPGETAVLDRFMAIRDVILEVRNGG